MRKTALGFAIQRNRRPECRRVDSRACVEDKIAASGRSRYIVHAYFGEAGAAGSVSMEHRGRGSLVGKVRRCQNRRAGHIVRAVAFEEGIGRGRAGDLETGSGVKDGGSKRSSDIRARGCQWTVNV